MQLTLDIAPELPPDAYQFGKRSDGETHGLVLTKPHVVNLILDLAGYAAAQDLSRVRLLEPSCGMGAFLVPAVERLLASAARHGRKAEDLYDSVRAFDIDPNHVAASRGALFALLCSNGVQEAKAHKLVNTWVLQGDFLLANISLQFDVIVGNPPYIRIEQLSRDLQTAYRTRYSTLYDRADIYVAFIERCLRLLEPAGRLAFICADRWVLNRYGAPLRRLITANYSVQAYVDLHQASPFESEVIAYPSIFVVAREEQAKRVAVAHLSSASPAECVALTQALQSGISQKSAGFRSLDFYEGWFSDDAPWVLSPPACRNVLRSLEAQHPLLEDSGRTAVRIGVATGSDRVLIVPEDAPIEEERLLPLVMRDDIDSGTIKHGKRCVINTYEEGAGVIDLSAFPRLKRYLEDNRDLLAKRHIAQKSKNAWFRTIDRVYPSMVKKPKLLIPDIAGSNEVVFEPGGYYPHHNLYFILSDEWDLEVLGGLLSSRVALFFVWSYAVKMRGGYLRFQAQYLRRIRVPKPETMSPELKASVKKAFRSRDFPRLDELALRAYKLSELPNFDFVDTRK